MGFFYFEKSIFLKFRRINSHLNKISEMLENNDNVYSGAQREILILLGN